MARGRSSAYVALLLLVVLAFALPGNAWGATQAELDAHRQKAADARAAAAEAEELAAKLKAETEAMDSEIAILQADVDELDPQVEDATARTERLRAEVESLRAQIAAKEAQITETQAEYDRQQGLLGNRMTTSYKQGALYYVDLLLGSKNWEDLIARTALVQRVIDDNVELATGLAYTRDELEDARVELDRTLDNVTVKRTEAEVAERQLKDLQAQRQSVLNDQENLQAQKTELMEESEANAERLRAIAEEEEAESARIEAELRSTSSAGGGYFNGVMAWPTPGFYRITSQYGYRIHPIFGTEKLHTGIDIGRNLDPEQSINGATVVAAGDGEVIYSGYRGGYGNTVMIDHGDGVVSLYAHMQSGSLVFSEGEWVTKGVKIGQVGSTGYSTGPHMHFEVRVNGSATDPMPYLQ